MAPLRAPSARAAHDGRPLRVLSLAVVIAGAASGAIGQLSHVDAGLLFCGSGAARLLPEVRVRNPVAMNTINYERRNNIGADGGYSKKSKPKNKAGGTMSGAALQNWRMKPPSVPNTKDRYFLLWARSATVREWKPFNLVSGNQLGKTLESVKENSVAQAVGVSGLAAGQIVKQLGMNIYKNLADVRKQCLEMHPDLGLTKKDLEFGFKEIPDNEQFNKEPFQAMRFRNNITSIPPESELRNLLDDASDAISSTPGLVTQASDNVKNFFSGLGR